MTFQTKLFLPQALDIRATPNALPEDFKAVKEYMMRGTCPVDSLVSAIVKPEGASDILAYWNGHRGDVFRILVEF